MKKRGAGPFTMKVDQNPLAENPNEGVAQRGPISWVGRGYVTEAFESLRCRLQSKDINGGNRRGGGETGELPTWASLSRDTYSNRFSALTAGGTHQMGFRQYPPTIALTGQGDEVRQPVGDQSGHRNLNP